MAIRGYKNGHFEEMAAWSQILQIVGNSTVFYLSFDTHDSPGSVFVCKSKFDIGFGIVGKIESNVPVCAVSGVFEDINFKISEGYKQN